MNEQKKKTNESVNTFQQPQESSFTYPILTKIVDFLPTHTFIFRICLLGDSNVGKTSVLTRYCDNIFKPKYCNTIGVDFKVVTLKYQETIAKVHIWDTAGQERFKSIAINYFKSSNGFIFIYDITSEKSFKNVNNWIELAFANNKTAVVNFLVGNKNDLENERKVLTQQGEELARKGNYIFFETSALTSANVDRLFEYFTFKLIEYYDNNKGLTNPNDNKGNEKKASNIDIKTDIQTNKCNC